MTLSQLMTMIRQQVLTYLDSGSRHGSFAIEHPVVTRYLSTDAGLGPGTFPDRAARLQPGLLEATRTGLAPAGDDELVVVRSALLHHLQLAGRTNERG
jgi:hypothetical protein